MKVFRYALILLPLTLLSSISVGAETLPESLKWITDDHSPEWSSQNSIPGGEFHISIPSFPETLRTVGSGSNTLFRSFLTDNQMPLTFFHPNNGKPLPALATHWAYGKDKKTIYYRLNPQARWSDGEPVTSDDFLFALEFMRSPHIRSPWHNEYYEKRIESISAIDPYTIAIRCRNKTPRSEMHYYCSVKPRPAHFHMLTHNWPERYDWSIEPNTGPYQISSIQPGTSVEFSRKTDWWANELRYMRNRFNVSTVILTAYRNPNTAFAAFESGELDTFNMTPPRIWHDKTNSPVFTKGLIHRITFYNQHPRNARGLFLNTENNILKNRSIRKALAHSINFDYILKSVLRNEHDRLQSFRSGYQGYSLSLKPPAFNLRKAIDLLKKAGWKVRNDHGIRIKDNRELSLPLIYTNKLHEPRLKAIRKDALRAGISLELKYVPHDHIREALDSGNYAIAMTDFGTSFSPEYYDFFHSDTTDQKNSANITRLSDQKIDAAILSYQKASSESTKARAAVKIEKLLAAKYIFIPGTMIPYTRAGYWRWMQLPESHGTKSSHSLFDPFNIRYGGLFWIDNKVKVNTLAAKRTGKGFASSSVTDTAFATP